MKFREYMEQLEGISFVHDGDIRGQWGLIVHALFDGDIVGTGRFLTGDENAAEMWEKEDSDYPKPNQMWPEMIEVKGEFQRKGIATAIIKYAEKMTGMTAIMTPRYTPDGAALMKSLGK